MPAINSSIKEGKNKFSNLFLVLILIGILYLCYLLFRPFINEIVISAVLVAIFYPVYLKFVYWTRGWQGISSFLVCLLIFLIIIIPISYFLFYIANQSLALYSSLSSSFANGNLSQFLDIQIWQKLNFSGQNIIDTQKLVVDALTMVRGFLFAAATALIKGTSQFFVSLLIIFFTMYFLFVDGRSLLRRLMELTPLANQYDKLIWIKFRDVSFTIIVATFVTALAQALTGVIAFFIIGWPVLLAGVLIFGFAFLPYVGAAFVWLPVAIYLIAVGQVWQGIFLLIWGILVISLVDNFLRPYLIKGKAQVHPLIIFFSILGGILIFGGWGVIFGPLIVALAVTILHIYELEYSKLLNR